MFALSQVSAFFDNAMPVPKLRPAECQPAYQSVFASRILGRHLSGAPVGTRSPSASSSLAQPSSSCQSSPELVHIHVKFRLVRTHRSLSHELPCWLALALLCGALASALEKCTGRAEWAGRMGTFPVHHLPLQLEVVVLEMVALCTERLLAERTSPPGLLAELMVGMSAPSL